jgi:diacylglycerol kinase (ATP)
MTSPALFAPSKLRLRGVFNPSSHSGRARRQVAGWSRGPHAVPVEWIESRSPAHLQDVIRAAQDQDLAALLVAGGDGTVTLAADALRDVEQRVPLAILPAGSGNDFARDLGIRGNLATPAALLAYGYPRDVDLIEVLPGGARAVCVASVGFDARALELIHGSRWPRSRLLNVYASLRALLTEPPPRVRVTWEGGGYEGPAVLVGVTNTRGYGGGFLLSPDAVLDDGLLDLCLVEDVGRARLLATFPRIFRGAHRETPGVRLVQTPWVRIESLSGELPLCLDGDLPRHATPVELRCRPRALRVIAPHLTPRGGGQ